jgi:hypothetical protein
MVRQIKLRGSETGDWKVARTGRLESLPYSQAPAPVRTHSTHRRIFSMTRLMRFVFALLLLGLLALPTSVRAQGNEPMVYTVGLTAEANGQHWAYLHWRSTALDLFAPRNWSVWRKDGLPDAPGNYRLEAVVRVQTSAAAIGGLQQRARLALGEDPFAIRTALTELFEELVPQTTLSDAELASAVIQGVAGKPELLGSLQLAARTFPSLAMALGTAHAVPIPANGPVTFEIRHRPTPDSADEAVLGRVTVNAAAPLQLPAPSTVQLAPPDPNRPATADLAIPLRWDTPPPLRRYSLAQHGFNVWRVDWAYAVANNWHVTPPPASALRNLAQTLGPVGRVNQAPVLPGRSLDAVEAATSDHTVFFATDHAIRFPGYPAVPPPQNGDQYYYFVTARDLLGRDGAVSPGVLGTFCSRMPPRVPKVLRVENDYQNPGTPQQHLRVRWAANPPEEDKATTAYAVYRWENTGQLTTLGGSPTANLIGTVPHTGNATEFSFLDNGPGSPAAPADYAKTYWYTVRAIDDTTNAVACATPPFGGNISGHSPPVPGVLRDRTGPGSPEGGLRIQCAEPFADIGRRVPGGEYPSPGPLSATYINVDVVFVRTNQDPNLAWVELDWGLATARAPVGRFEFEPGEIYLPIRLTYTAAAEGVALWFQARVGTVGGSVVQTEQLTVNMPAPGPEVGVVVSVLAGVNYVTGLVDPVSGRTPCEAHSPVPPEAEGTPNNDLEISFVPLPNMTQYKLYYRVDDGPLTLLREDSGTFDTNTPIVNLWTSTPLYAGEACFFVQAFDRHGNPGPLAPLGCVGLNFKFAPTAPMLAPIRPTGSETNPVARIQWFGPRWGLRSFQVLIQGLPIIPDGTVPGLTYQDSVMIGVQFYRRYVTPDLRDGFGNGSSFQVEVPLEAEADIQVYVRGNTVTGGQTPRSNKQRFTWSPPEEYIGPNVPWPARKLPPTRTATSFHPNIVAESNPAGGGGMVRIGELIGRISHDVANSRFLITTTDVTDPLGKVYPRLGAGEPRRVTPFVLYRTQVPSLFWPQVPGDVSQVSPRMEAIAWATTANGYDIYDPFVYVKQPNGATATPTDPGYMYVVDTQPVVARAMYRYYLVLLHPVTGEIEEVLVTNDVSL